MTSLAIAIILTLGISFFCSLFEAIMLGTTPIEIETIKKNHPARGNLLEKLYINISDTISTILTLNTIANTLGSIIIGGLVGNLFGHAALGIASALITLTILVCSELIPKNLGVVYRRQLQPHIIIPLTLLNKALHPITWFCKAIVRFVIKTPNSNPTSNEEIILLAQKGAKEGSITQNESSIIANALTLDDTAVGEIMTPRTVIFAIHRNATINDIFTQHPTIPFARIPVYDQNLDHIIGFIRRRELLNARANNQNNLSVAQLTHDTLFIPDTATAAQALQLFLKNHQQLAIAINEFGATSGVITMEDVIEHLLGREIFEQDDIAIDMRELARSKLQSKKQPTITTHTPPAPPPAANS